MRNIAGALIYYSMIAYFLSETTATEMVELIKVSCTSNTLESLSRILAA